MESVDLVASGVLSVCGCEGERERESESTAQSMAPERETP